jgi:hypothetical protein
MRRKKTLQKLMDAENFTPDPSKEKGFFEKNEGVL